MRGQQSKDRTFRRNVWIAAGMACLCAAVLFVMGRGGDRGADPSRRNDATAQVTKGKGAPGGHGGVPSGANAGTAPPYGADPADGSLTDKGPSTGSAGAGELSINRSARRGSVATPSGRRKSLVDPMASWRDLPPWPEGPRLFAEVETTTRTYVNLRPDDYGALPEIRTSAGERVELRIHFPEGAPGEKIFVEIPNGGSFPDSGKSFARICELPENRTLSLPYITDDSHGYCTVVLRHRGHTRSLPIWVGEPPETTSADF